MKKKIALLFVLAPVLAIAQLTKIDSLHIALHKAKADTSIINIWIRLAEEYIYTMPDSTNYYAEKAKTASIKAQYQLGILKAYVNIGSAAFITGKGKLIIPTLLIEQKKGEELVKMDNSYQNNKVLGSLYNVIGNNYFVIGNIDSAYVFYKQSLASFSKIKYKKGIATSFLNCSNVEGTRGDVTKALKNLFASLALSEQIKDKKVIAFCYNNIAKIYNEQNEVDKALVYFKKALSTGNEINLTNITTVANYNIATLLLVKNKVNEALPYAEKSLELSKLMNSDSRIAGSLSLLGNLYTEQGRDADAIKIINEAIVIAEKANDKIVLGNAYSMIIKVYLNQKNYDKAFFYASKALKIAQEAENLASIQSNSSDLSIILKAQGKYKEALEMKELAIAMRDSTVNQGNQKELMNQEFKYAYDKQAIADSLKYDNDKKIQSIETQANLRTQRNKQIALSIGLLLAIVSGAILYNRFKVIQKQKGLIETQSKRLELAHLQLEEKSKEIQDSIIYSKEIQNLFLKSVTQAPHYFYNSILIYKPKATVSGDFYWYKEINEHLVIVIGDCTGHGVPGAIISVLAIQSLEQAITQVKDFKQLHELNELMNKEFSTYYKQENHVGIGLDFSALVINKKENTMYVSGSGGCIILKTKTNELINQKFESINIGGSMPVIYNPTTSTYNLSNLSSIFLYTDGITDQKSEATGKKFGTKKLIELISKLNTNEPDKALQIIENTLTDWQGKTTQIDDMTLLGIQFT